MINDCISRQAALVAVKDALMAWSYMPKWRDEKILEAIAELPSAQPTSSKMEQVPTRCNLIDRRAAIDALCGYLVGKRCHDDGTLTCRLIENEVINKLPSAQPQIVRCKDCKHHWTHKCMDSMPIERCDLEQTFYDAEHDFCSLAERRTE